VEDLHGRVAVVTGGGSGIGAASARCLAAAGVAVVVADRDEPRAGAVAREILAGGGQASPARCDVTSVTDVAGLARDVLDAHGRVDIVMSNVGTLAVGSPLEIPLSEWERVIDVNLLSAVRINAVFLPLLLAQGEGHVVYTASYNGLWSYSWDRLPYTATKAALVAMAEALALYLLPRGVGVTCLCPGPVATNIAEQTRRFGERARLARPALDLLDPAVVGAQVVDAIRAGTWLALTHHEMSAEMVARARDPEAFLRRHLSVEDDVEAGRSLHHEEADPLVGEPGGEAHVPDALDHGLER